MAGILIDDGELERMVGEYLRDTIARHARAILEHQMKDIVASELARLRLADPSSKTLEGMVNDALATLIDSRLHAILGPIVKEQLRLIMNRATSPT